MSRGKHVDQHLLGEMRRHLQANGISPRPLGPGETADEALLRYLRARNLSPEKAAAMYAGTVRWRDENDIDELRKCTGAEALGSSSVETLRKFLPHAQTGFDCVGGPVIFKHMGVHCKIRQAVSEGISLDALARYNIWLNEQYMDALASANAREWSVIVDAAGWHVGLFDSYGFRFLKRTATTDAAHYPDLLRQMIVVNAPPMLAYAWRVIRTWLDAETREKIDILSEGNPERAREVLLSRFDPKTLPAQYGGSAPPLPSWPERAGLPPAKITAAAGTAAATGTAAPASATASSASSVHESNVNAVELRTTPRDTSDRTSKGVMKTVYVEIVPQLS